MMDAMIPSTSASRLPRPGRALALAACLGLSLVASVPAAAAFPAPHDLDPTKEHPRSSEGSFVTLRSGRILFEYSQFSGGQADHSPSAIAEIFSDDQGRTWSAPRVVVPTGAYQNIMSVSLLRLASGKLARFYAVKRNKWLDCHAVISISTDEGATWSEPRLVTDAPGYFVLNNDRVIQTASGRLIVPLGFHRSKSTADDESAWDGRALALWYYSDDEGASWKEADTWWGMPALSTSGLQEPGVVQLPDGSIYSWFRTDQGAQFESVSRDNGVTWSAPRATELKSPVSPASIKRLPASNTLIAVYNDHSGSVPAPPSPKQRAPLVARFSTDGARTWGPPETIESDLTGWYCYTSIHFTDDAVLLAYCAGNAEIGRLSRLRLRRIPLADLHPPKA
ncbi:MAG: repeat-like protein [Verrucomicrobia bacterium]|nr:repeat-like protein [Verrucomicrobiota bacterium]